VEQLSLVHRYARALFELSRARDVTFAVGKNLEKLIRLLKRYPEVMNVLTNPEIPKEFKVSLLVRAVAVELNPATVRMIELLVQRGDAELLPGIQRSYAELRKQAAGILEVEVESAWPLGEESQDEVRLALCQATGRRVVLTEKVNPGLLGGLRVRVADRVYDGSLASRVADLHDRLVHELAPNGAPALAEGG